MRTLLLLLTAAIGPATFQPGQWQIATAPGTATLNGRSLGDLPYTGPAAPEAICLTSAQASDPAAWLARDLPTGCTLTRRSIANGRVDVTGTCPAQAEGLARGQHPPYRPLDADELRPALHDE